MKRLKSVSIKPFFNQKQIINCLLAFLKKAIVKKVCLRPKLAK